MRILHRYVWQEFIGQFSVCFFGFFALGLGKIIFDYNDIFIGYRVTFKMTWMMILNQLPLLCMDLLPAACLFGIILGLGRLLRDREFQVMRLGGSTLTQTILPIFVGIAIMCGFAFVWNDRVVPSANHRFTQALQKLSIEENLPMLKENLVIKAPYNRFIYLKKVDHKQGQLGGVMIIEAADSREKWARLITAQRGTVDQGVWKLEEGIIHEFDDNGAIFSELKYDRMDIKMAQDLLVNFRNEKNPDAMTSKELWQQYEASVRSGLNSPVYAVYFHQKFADPLISLVLAFLAVPLTILTGRNARWQGMVYCFLIIMAYYTIQVVGRTMGANGVVMPWLAAWAPHLLFLSIGVGLFSVVEHHGGS